MKWVAEGMINPDARGTGIYLYFLTAIAHTQEESAVIGGSQALRRSSVTVSRRRENEEPIREPSPSGRGQGAGIWIGTKSSTHRIRVLLLYKH